MLTETFEILRWNGEYDRVLDQVERAYTSLLASSLGSSLAQLRSDNPELADQMTELLTQTDEDSLRRVLLAPETSSRVLCGHPGACDKRDLWRYLMDVLEVEAARPALTADKPRSRVNSRRRWSATGDVCVDDSGAAVAFQRALTGLAVDSESPTAVCFDSSSVPNGPMQLEHYGDRASKVLAIGRIETAMRTIEAADPSVAAFVRRFTLVAHIVVDRGTVKFSSGSSGEYTGRSIFCNAHIPGVNTALLAEALVHEAIHSFLYMQEACHPWIVGEEQLPDEVVVRSPWTGALLYLRNFLQACFVWFGLAHFWMRLRGGSAFEARHLETRLATARQGFLKGPLLGRISASLPYIASQILSLVDAMQVNITAGECEIDFGGDRAGAVMTGHAASGGRSEAERE